MRVRGIAGCLVSLVVAFGLAEPAAGQQKSTPAKQQGFRLCNLTGDSIEAAKALNSGATDGKNRIIISEGWYQFKAAECAYLWTGPLQYRYYLLYAQNKKIGREWKGDIPLCVSSKPFTIRSDLCGPDAYRRMFFQVDTRDNESWTQNLRP